MNNKYIAKCVLKVAKNLIASDESWEKVKSPLLKELKKHFKGITEKNNNFFFDYKDCKCYIGYTDGFKSYYFMTGHDSKKRINVPFLSDPDSQTLIQKFKNIVDKRLASDPSIGVLKNSVSKHFKNWNIDKISKTSQGLKVEISKKAYGDGYDVFCQIKNGRVYDSDSRGLIVDEAEKVAKETGIKDFIIVGYAD